MKKYQAKINYQDTNNCIKTIHIKIDFKQLEKPNSITAVKQELKDFLEDIMDDMEDVGYIEED